MPPISRCLADLETVELPLRRQLNFVAAPSNMFTSWITAWGRWYSARAPTTILKLPLSQGRHDRLAGLAGYRPSRSRRPSCRAAGHGSRIPLPSSKLRLSSAQACIAACYAMRILGHADGLYFACQRPLQDRGTACPLASDGGRPRRTKMSSLHP